MYSLNSVKQVLFFNLIREREGGRETGRQKERKERKERKRKKKDKKRKEARREQLMG